MSADVTQQEVESAIAVMESQAVIFANKFIPDSAVRIEYIKMSRKASREILEQLKSSKLTPQQAAAKAHELRNTLLDASRGKLSNIGRAWSQNLKKIGKTLPELESYYANKLFNLNFNSLTQTNKNRVWKEIVAASGRPRASVNTSAKVLGVAGRGFVVVTVSFALHNIISSDDKTRATAKEAAVIGSSLGGMAVGGYVASLACGPGAFICATAWTFAIGAAAAFGSEVAFDYAW